MKTIKLTNAEADLLKQVLPKRIERLQGWDTPEQYRRNMWPISVDSDMMINYEAKHKVRQANIKLYQSMLKKLGA